MLKDKVLYGIIGIIVTIKYENFSLSDMLLLLLNVRRFLLSQSLIDNKGDTL